ncbi:hypothetical protein SKAU_G00385140 [Synaphobranchus kaupii]|uniref:Uncharacterized protein n=1 Tax=Synaphobranchus kaupii TaxID=118154 RepID=A0A9Q1EEE4_SYNKA|nr:hypothetical protein SKAU_G00385140 [Synaphobranchus kaupii]
MQSRAYGAKVYVVDDSHGATNVHRTRETSLLTERNALMQNAVSLITPGTSRVHLTPDRERQLRASKKYVGRGEKRLLV